MNKKNADAVKFKRGLAKVLVITLALVYPVLVFTLLVVLKLPVRVLSLCVIALAFAYFLSAGVKSKNKTLWQNVKPLLTATLFLAAGLACFFKALFGGGKRNFFVRVCAFAFF